MMPSGSIPISFRVSVNAIWKQDFFIQHRQKWKDSAESAYLNSADASEAVQRALEHFVSSVHDHIHSVHAIWQKDIGTTLHRLAEEIDAHQFTTHAGPLTAHAGIDEPNGSLFSRWHFLEQAAFAHELSKNGQREGHTEISCMGS